VGSVVLPTLIFAVEAGVIWGQALPRSVPSAACHWWGVTSVTVSEGTHVSCPRERGWRERVRRQTIHKNTDKENISEIKVE
jgi:hypothetical protein